jgi:hypothetical protein
VKSSQEIKIGDAEADRLKLHDMREESEMQYEGRVEVVTNLPTVFGDTLPFLALAPALVRISNLTS